MRVYYICNCTRELHLFNMPTYFRFLTDHLSTKRDSYLFDGYPHLFPGVPAHAYGWTNYTDIIAGGLSIQRDAPFPSHTVHRKTSFTEAGVVTVRPPFEAGNLRDLSQKQICFRDILIMKLVTNEVVRFFPRRYD